MNISKLHTFTMKGCEAYFTNLR